MHFSDILQWCKNGRKTGTLAIGRREVRKDVYFEEGKIVSAGSNEPREYLGQHLISRGMISEEQFAEAFEEQKETGVLLGKVLVLHGTITEDKLEEALREKILEMIFNIFLWQTGDFHFSERTLSPKDRRVEVNMDIDACILEGARKMDEWKRCRAVLPSDLMTVSLGENRVPGGRMSAQETRILELAGEGRSIEEICLELHASSFTVLPLLYSLQSGGRIIVGPGKGKAAHAGTKAGARKFRSDGEEGAWLLDEVVPTNAVPFLLVKLEDLRGSNLTSEEAFVLSRINGRWSIGSIVAICPIGELQALRILGMFLEKRMISLQAPGPVGEGR